MGIKGEAIKEGRARAFDAAGKVISEAEDWAGRVVSGDRKDRTDGPDRSNDDGPSQS